jgi:hypothetical protein
MFVISQGGSWYVTMIEVGVKILFCLIAYYFRRKQDGAKGKLADGLGEVGLDQLNI